jgi:hypothetical protein
MVERLLKAYTSVVNKRDDEEQYPVFSRRGDLMYYLTGKELATTTIGPKTAKESEEYSSYIRSKLLKQDKQRVIEDITDAILDDDLDRANKLIEKYQVIPSVDTIHAAILRRSVDSKTRRILNRTEKDIQFYEQETGESSPYKDY